jgi:MFS family permease
LFRNQQSEIDTELPSSTGEPMPPEAPLSPRKRHYIIIASLLALFLGALDALVMSAAMPTIVADLGGLPLYSWVYSAYFLARAVALPVLASWPIFSGPADSSLYPSVFSYWARFWRDWPRI